MKTFPATEANCPICGTPLPGGAFDGICVACAWRIDASPEGDAGPPPTDDGVLFRVTGHEVLAEIARGGAGIVYRARQLNPAREVALKMLLPQQLGSDEMIARFRVEAETVATLEHAAILPVYTADVHCGMPFFTMKLATGGTLGDRREELRGRWREIAELTAILAEAVQFAHSRGVIHRDLKPGNILFDEAGRPFISDFGLAKFVGADSSVTRTHNLLGTPAYLAPEVAQRGAQVATTASDVYGLGAVLYELLTERPPFSADSLSALLRAVAESPPESPRRRVPGVPRDLEIVCLCCLAKEPAQRFASAGELAAELRRWLEGRPIVSRPVSPVERAWRWARRRPALAALSLALLATLVGGGIAQWLSNQSLSRALAATRSAENDAKQKLHVSLLSEARLQSRSRQPGQREKTLEILAQAARIGPTVEVRSETATALSRADLTLVRELPGTFPAGFGITDFSPDLAAYVMPLPEGGLALRSTEDGRMLRRYAMPAGAVPLHLWISRDGRWLGVIFADYRTGFWPIDGDKPVWVNLPDTGNVTPTSIHPSKPLVAYRSGDSEIRLRDLPSGAEQAIASGGTRVWALTFDPQGGRLAVVRDRAVELRDVTTGAIIWSVPEAPLGMPPGWSDDGRLLATANANSTDLSIRDAAHGRVVQTLAGHTTHPGLVRFLPDGQSVASISFDRTLRLWDVAAGRELLQAPLATRGFKLSPDGRRLGAATETDQPALFAWADQAVFRELVVHSRPGTSNVGFAISADGEWLATGSRGALPRDNRQIGQVEATILDRHRQVGSFSFDTAINDRVTLQVDARESAVVYSVSSGGIWRRQIRPGAGGPFTLGEATAVGSATNRFLISIDSREGDWIVWRVAEKTFAFWLLGDPTRETDVPARGLNPNGIVHLDRRHLVTRDAPDGELRLRSSQTGAEIGRIATSRPARVAFSPRGDFIVVGMDTSYRAWTLPGLQPGPEWPVRNDGSPGKRFSFSPSGRWFAGEAGGNAIELRDGRSFELLVRLEPPLKLEVGGLVWAPDESRVYLRSRGPRIFYWDLPVLRRELARRGVDW